MDHFIPIPEGAKAEATSIAPGYTHPCDKKWVPPVEERDVVEVKPDATPRPYKPYDELSYRSAPTGGNWSKIRESGMIKMTPMRAGTVKEWNHIGTIQWPVIAGVVSANSFHHAFINGRCVPCAVAVPNHGPPDFQVKTYSESGDLAYWQQKYPSFRHFGLNRGFDNAKVEAAKAAAYQELFQAYNLGEEIAEFRSAVTMVVSLLKKGWLLLLDFQKQLDKLTRGGKNPFNPKNAADVWLTYRYGLMPIVFSIQDIIALAESEGRFKTVRKKVYPDRQLKLPPLTNCFYDVGVDASVVSITAKGRWSSSTARIKDTVNVNPFTTAATVYPWALVVRWFFNVNSALDSWVKSFTTTSAHQACVATKISRKVDTYLNVDKTFSKVLYRPGNSGPCGKGYYPPFGPLAESRHVRTDVLLRTLEEERYERVLFSPLDVKLVWNPSIDFKRSLDALSFLIGTLKPLSKGVKL